MNSHGICLMAVALLVGTIACGPQTVVVTTPPGPSPRPTLSPVDQSELAQLEARPIKIPALPGSGVCPTTDDTSVKPFKDQSTTTLLAGSGPVYAGGGPEIDSARYNYFDVVYYADPSVQGVVLIRIQTLDGRHKGVFAGEYGVGQVVDTDTIDGTRTQLYDEVALPLGRPALIAGLGAGWTSWRVRQGVDSNWQCVGIQIDSPAATEVIVAAK